MIILLIFKLSSNYVLNQLLIFERYNFVQNTLGTKHLVDLCEQFHFLEQFVHVSTAYANCHLRDVDERVYPMNKDIDQLIELFK